MISSRYEILLERIKATRSIQRRTQRVHITEMWTIHNAQGKDAISQVHGNITVGLEVREVATLPAAKPMQYM